MFIPRRVAPFSHFFEAVDIGTMRASASSRTPDKFTTLPLACLFSGAFVSRSISTGKERDTKSGNDYFGARYYASSMGRFLSPEWGESPMPVPYANFTNPQTLNLYAYVSNNPLRRNDPTGHAAKAGPIELRSGTMRVDTASADQVKVHVFPKSGGEFRGRLNPDTRTIEWTKGAPPKAISEEAQGWLLARNKYAIAAAKREMSVLGGTRGAEEGEAGGGSRLMEAGSWLLMALQVGDMAANAARVSEINKLEGTTGFHEDLDGTMHVTDLNKFGDTFGVGAGVSVNGDVFRLKGDGTWTDSYGQQLYQDSTGFHIKQPSA
jgi:RHS repeat-associated protein